MIVWSLRSNGVLSAFLVSWQLPPYVVLAFMPVVFRRVWPCALGWLATSCLVIVCNAETHGSTSSTAGLGYLIPAGLAIPLFVIVTFGGALRVVWSAIRASRRLDAKSR